MRVLFFGQTGVSKRECIERLARRCLTTAKLSEDLENVRSMKFLSVFHFEDFISNRMAGDYIAYLDLFNMKRQATEWREAWNSVMSKIRGGEAENVFITLHATYFRRNRFFSMLDIDAIREFAPDVIITLIDDAYECWHRIQTREVLHPRGTRLRLRDVFLWRTVEVMAGDFLVQGTNKQHYIVAVKQPAEMVRRLVFEPSKKRIYASFPISSTRSSSDSRNEVDSFRMNLHHEFTVFDPLTIDERVLVSAYNNRMDEDTDVILDLNNRWPTGFTGELEPLSPPYDPNYPLRVPTDQIREVIEDIDRQIEARDYRLIDQVQAVAAFRPSFLKHLSRGVNAELLYAAQGVGIPVHLYWNESEDGTYGDSPFGAVGTPHNSVADLIKAL